MIYLGNSKYIVQWHITHKCNLRCVHCYQEDYYEHMSMKKFYECLDKIDEFVQDKYMTCQINLTGGEPLVHPNFFEMANEIVLRGYKLGILTNGTLMTDIAAKKIAELKPMFVQVSLDGCEETHNKIRGTGAFQKALMGIDMLKKYEVKVLVSFTAQKQNIQDFSKLVKICHKHNVDKIWWDRVVTENKGDTEKLALSTKEFKDLVKKTNRIKFLYSLLRRSIIVSTERALQFNGNTACGYKCSVGENLLIILANGDIMACRRLPFVFGNISDGSINEILKASPDYQRLCDLSIPNDCKNCKDLSRCYGGSKCVTYAQTNSLEVKDVNCWR